MTSFVSLLLAVASATGPASSTSPASTAAPPTVRSSVRMAEAIPPSCAASVQRAVAALWAVPDERVQLSFGRAPDDIGRATAASARLTGRGIDGWFVALFDVTGRPTPIALRVRAGVTDTVCVAARPIASGERLTGADIRRDVRTSWGAPRPHDVEPSAGWEVRRAIGAGDVLTASVASAPCAVTSGEPVTVVWRSGAVSVTQRATALASARWGETVRVRLDGRGARVIGRAVDRGVVAIAAGETAR